jgi:hemoglobin/transferrin/lactoferrin receptor protein
MAPRFPLGLALLAACLLLAAPAIADEPATRLDEVLVTPARRESPRFCDPHAVDVVGGEDLSGVRAPRATTDAIAEVPGVMAQRTAYGQGSPFIRGLTGFRTLTLIDGVRLNNSVWRDGPNQYFATVDALSLSRMEVVRGPSSVLYGSDSMGGTVNLLPLGPETVDGVYSIGGRLYQRFASAEGSSVTRLQAQGPLDESVGVLLGVGYKSFDDLRAGDGLLRETGYTEWVGDGRVLWSLAERLDLTLGYQRVSQDDVPRTHKTVHARSWRGTSVGSERRRTLDQARDLLYLRARWDEPWGGTEEATATVSWHHHREARHRVRGDGRSDRQGLTVHSIGLALQAVLDTPAGGLTVGVDAYRDHVDSYQKKYDAAGRLTSESIQGPVADDAIYDLVGLYVEDELEPVEQVVVRLGARGTYVRADADSVADPVSGEEIEVDDSWRAVTGSVRVSYLGLEGANLWTGVSQAFRAPNLSDLTRFDSARSNEVETPSPDLDPERALSFEAGAKAAVGPLRGEIALFHTVLDDLIQRFPTGTVIDGDDEVTKDNVGDGFVRGVEIGGEVDLGAGVSVFGSGALLYGKVDTYPTSDREKKAEYIDRLPPLSGRVGLRYRGEEGLFAEVRARMADRADRLSPRDEADTQRIPPGGTPGYTAFDVEASYRFHERCSIGLALENIANRAYRVHGSGQNEPGRNLVVTLDLCF